MYKEANDVFISDLSQIHQVIGEKNSFKDATVLMTGCAGFLGFYIFSYLVRYSKQLQIKKVIGLDTFILGKPEWLKDLIDEFPETLEVQAFDIAKDSLANVSSASDANYVIHGASIASPTFYRKYPVETLDANIWGLRGVLDFYKNNASLKGLLFFSSSEIYGDPDPANIPTTEEYRGNVSCNGPRSCYDESKRLGETLCWVYSEEFKMPITVVRPFNNFGPGMKLNDKRLPADFASSVLQNEPIVILSNGAPTRTFCYVSDAVTGYLLALLHGKYDYFNIGQDNPELSVKEFAEIFASTGELLFGYSTGIDFKTSEDQNYLVDNPNRRCPDISKARKVLGFNPKVGPQEGVRRFLTYLAGQNK